jgi:hypothetical protein
MKRLSLFAALFTAAITAALSIGAVTASAATTTCTQTGFYRDGINLTAAVVGTGGAVTGPVDAAATIDGVPCNIGVYLDSTHTGSVTGEVSGASYYGVVVNATTANITGANIHNIGDTPFGGNQHGVGVFYTTLGGQADGTNDSFTTGTSASGKLSSSTITRYQKNGVVVNGTGASVAVTGNTVSGVGPTTTIAQNGIEFARGASGSASDNTVSGNQYSGANNASSGGFLVFGGPAYGSAYTTGITINNNTATNNDVGVFVSNLDLIGNAPTTRTNNTVKFNTITNSTVTNTTGSSSSCGYQAGVSDAGTKDGIVNNAISGIGYTPITGDCTGTAHAFLRFVDAGSTARAVNSNK